MASNRSHINSSFSESALNASEKKKPPWLLRRFQSAVLFVPLCQFSGCPITKVQIFPDFSTFVTVFQRLFGPIIHLTKRMLRVADCFTNHFYGFGHSEVSFFWKY